GRLHVAGYGPERRGGGAGWRRGAVTIEDDLEEPRTGGHARGFTVERASERLDEGGADEGVRLGGEDLGQPFDRGAVPLEALGEGRVIAVSGGLHERRVAAGAGVGEGHGAELLGR